MLRPTISAITSPNASMSTMRVVTEVEKTSVASTDWYQSRSV